MPVAKTQKTSTRWDLVKDLFDQCLKLSPQERAAFLNTHLKDEPELRAEIEELLANHSEEDSSLMPAVPAIIDAFERERFVPRLAGKYLLLDKIGSGGMAEVFLARVTGARGFEKLLAVKRIAPNYASDPHFREMFEFEARLCSQLEHPNIVQVHDFVQTDGTYLIVMEYVRGQNLQRITQKLSESCQRMSLEYTLHIVNEVCRALDYAHGRKDESTGSPLGLIHRDISLKNVMVTYDGAVKLLDFGIAKARNRATLTRTGWLRGTLQYLSPEDTNGGAKDHRSDLFSVGIVLYELLSGRHLFEGDNVFSIMKEIQDPASIERKIEELQVASEIKHILRKTLAQRPDDRYSDASQIQFDIQSFLNSQFMPLSAKRLATLMEGLFEDEMRQEQERLKEVAKKLESQPSSSDGDADYPVRTFILLGLIALTLGGIGLAVFEMARKGRVRDSQPIVSRAKPEEQVVVPPKTETSQAPPMLTEVQPTLPVGTCAALIDSEPPGASIHVNGVSVGTTPTTVRADCNHPVTVQLERPGYAPLKRKMQIVEQNSEVRFVLTPKEAAPVMVKPKPTGPDL